MFYFCLGENPADKKQIKDEWNASSGVGNIRFGMTYVIQGNFFYKKYVRFDEIERAFLRIESGEYGDIQLDDYSVVYILKSGLEAIMKAERRLMADKVLETIKEINPDIKIGKK